MKDNKISNLETMPQPLERIGLADALLIRLKHTDCCAITYFEMSKKCRQSLCLVKKLAVPSAVNEAVTHAWTKYSDVYWRSFLKLHMQK